LELPSGGYGTQEEERDIFFFEKLKFKKYEILKKSSQFVFFFDFFPFNSETYKQENIKQCQISHEVLEYIVSTLTGAESTHFQRNELHLSN
jgi:hypothetical protein